MGSVRVSCVANCACKDMVIDGHWASHTSLTEYIEMTVSPHVQCAMEMTVLPGSASPGNEHKFKISRIILNSPE